MVLVQNTICSLPFHRLFDFGANSLKNSTAAPPGTITTMTTFFRCHRSDVQYNRFAISWSTQDLLQWKDSLLSEEHEYHKRSRNGLFLWLQMAHNSVKIALSPC